MKDDKGFYYYPFPENKQVRMYVREVADDICFRMWNAPARAYDLDAARTLIEDK